MGLPFAAILGWLVTSPYTIRSSSVGCLTMSLHQVKSGYYETTDGVEWPFMLDYRHVKVKLTLLCGNNSCVGGLTVILRQV